MKQHLLNKNFRTILLLVDIGFLIYWSLIVFDLLPHSWVFQNYDDSTVKAWNWSFLPLDIAASLTGFLGLRKNGNLLLLAVSCTLTMVAGGMAIGFWAFQGFFNAGWWIPNIILFVVGLLGVLQLNKRGQ